MKSKNLPLPCRNIQGDERSYPTKIIYALSQENELCVSDIASIIGTTNSAISHQLRTLRNMKLVKYSKVGKVTFYSLDDIHINNLFAEGLRHVEDK